MMEWVETTGRSVDEAKAKAADALGVDELDAEFVVLAEARHGLFGRVKVPARVRARVRPVRPRPKIDRRDRRRRAERVGGDGASETAIRPATTRPRRTKRGAHRGASGGDTVESAELDRDRVALAPDDLSDPERELEHSAGPVTASGQHIRPAAETVADDLDEAEEETYDMDPAAMNDEAQRAADFLVGLADAFGTPATATPEVEEETIDIMLTGEDLGLLIGPRGATLQAVQDLTRAVAQRGGRAAARLSVDVAGYRKKRAEALTRFAVQIANEVIASGEPRSLEPMSAPDRKVVHDAVGTVAGVESVSEGEDPHRFVLVRPAG